MKTPRLFVQFPVSGRQVRLKIDEAVVNEGDCVDFWLVDGRNFRLAGGDMDLFVIFLPILTVINLPQAPPWYPSPQ